jgi:hypothetical protein
VKTLWNDDGPDVGAHFLNYLNNDVTQVPQIFPQKGWSSYTIQDIQAICQSEMTRVQCTPVPLLPGQHRRQAAQHVSKIMEAASHA